MGNGEDLLFSRIVEEAGEAPILVGSCRGTALMDAATGFGGSEGWMGKDDPALGPALSAELSSCRSFASILAILASVLSRRHNVSEGG